MKVNLKRSPVKYLFLSFWVLLLFQSCEKDPSKVDPVGDKYLISSKEITSISKSNLLKQASDLSPLVAAYVQNGIKVIRIEYNTINTDGKPIAASGLVVVPDSEKVSSMISVQHGTIGSDAEAPSNFKLGSEAASFGSLFGAMGYIVSYPDYIGYGASSAYPHPYEHRASLASASLDMLRALKEYLKKNAAIKWDNKLFVAGYSEGGYATMSLQKKIEQEASSEFKLVASSCGAGAYDKTAFMKYIVNNKTHGSAGYNKLYLWVLLTYDRIYSLNHPLSYYFKEPYASGIKTSGLDYAVPVSFDQILTDSFKKGLANGTDAGFVAAMADNDVYNWKPVTPTKLYHGTADQLVFYFNSENAYKAMKALGAPNVDLIPIPNGDHSSSIETFLIGTLLFFKTI